MPYLPRTSECDTCACVKDIGACHRTQDHKVCKLMRRKEQKDKEPLWICCNARYCLDKSCEAKEPHHRDKLICASSICDVPNKEVECIPYEEQKQPTSIPRPSRRTLPEGNLAMDKKQPTPTPVKRYSHYNDGETDSFYEYDDGEWIMYEDYEQMRKENEELKAEIQKTLQETLRQLVKSARLRAEVERLKKIAQELVNAGCVTEDSFIAPPAFAVAMRMAMLEVKQNGPPLSAKLTAKDIEKSTGKKDAEIERLREAERKHLLQVTELVLEVEKWKEAYYNASQERSEARTREDTLKMEVEKYKIECEACQKDAIGLQKEIAQLKIIIEQLENEIRG